MTTHTVIIRSQSVVTCKNFGYARTLLQCVIRKQFAIAFAGRHNSDDDRNSCLISHLTRAFFYIGLGLGTSFEPIQHLWLALDSTSAHSDVLTFAIIPVLVIHYSEFVTLGFSAQRPTSTGFAVNFTRVLHSTCPVTKDKQVV